MICIHEKTCTRGYSVDVRGVNFTCNRHQLPNVVCTNTECPGPGVIKLEYSLKLNIKHNDWLLADVSSQSLHFILSLRMNPSFITQGSGLSLPL